MEQKILIIHSTDRNIERNFWGYFFQSCGIWYKSRGFGMKSSELDEGYKEMYLTNSDDMGRISQTDPDAVYVLNEKPKEIMENICYFTWQEPETYMSILNALFPEEPYMGELLHCFLKHNIWRNSWFYHELPHTLSGFIAQTILDDCKNFIEHLQSLKTLSSKEFQRHRDFMILYCRYLGMGISWDYDSLEFIKNQSLLKDCKDMKESYGKSLSLWLITAKISYLSPITRPNVLNYLRMIQKLDGTANICYLIGLQCDVTYGNYELAKSFWLKGYQVDPNFIPTCYLKATILQQNNKYFEAVALFNRVIEFIQGDGKYSFSNVSEAMFLYHSMEHIADIAEFHYNNIPLQECMDGQIAVLKKTLDDHFDSLIICMDCISTDSFTKVFFHKGLEIVQKKLK